ncbi:MAG: cold shock domain-containing protein [Candidatus Omnitrophica bacterium]|nr:cold shock domain-containing protein [Candidatus Omnitrophota bacterium]MDE2008722.1 cold shock domain-containing protein [Candidatus Omnitrophota bacterium]MDE2214863.1 cold shock domain-containing protein [Candidatus Omnitrophota bacterium]MDE2231983.1 cold shock domain-containing protein [Candidatus Omnitrophota bacterium]
MSKGTVKEYNSDRGYGTIIDSATGQDLTVYANFIEFQKGQILKVGQEVEFDIEYQRSVNWAVHVRIV